MSKIFKVNYFIFKVNMFFFHIKFGFYFQLIKFPVVFKNFCFGDLDFPADLDFWPSSFHIDEVTHPVISTIPLRSHTYRQTERQMCLRYNHIDNEHFERASRALVCLITLCSTQRINSSKEKKVMINIKKICSMSKNPNYQKELSYVTQ